METSAGTLLDPCNDIQRKLNPCGSALITCQYLIFQRKKWLSEWELFSAGVKVFAEAPLDFDSYTRRHQQQKL